MASTLAFRGAVLARRATKSLPRRQAFDWRFGRDESKTVRLPRTTTWRSLQANGQKGGGQGSGAGSGSDERSRGILGAKELKERLQSAATDAKKIVDDGRGRLQDVAQSRIENTREGVRDGMEKVRERIEGAREGVQERIVGAKEAMEETRERIGGRIEQGKEVVVEKAEEGRATIRLLWKRYGMVAIGTYLGIYVVTLGGIFVAYDQGFASSKERPPGGTEVVERLRHLLSFLPEWAQKRLDQVYDKLMEDKRARNFALAWITTKLTEPVRLLLAFWLTPRIARAIGRAPPRSVAAAAAKASSATKK